MKHIKPLLFLFILSAAASLGAQTEDKNNGPKADSTKQINRAYTKITFQMKRFNEAVTGYVKTLKKAEPADTSITSDVEAYSDTLNKALEASDKSDSASIQRVKRAFDSLMRATVRLVKNVENDSNLRNNKTLKQLNNMMNNLKESIDRYQADLTEQFRKKDEAEITDEPKPADEPVKDPPKTKPAKK